MSETPKNIIYPDFGGPKKEPEEAKSEEDRMAEVIQLAGLLSGGKISEKMEKFTTTMKKVNQMRTFLRSLQAFHAHDTLAMRKEMVEDMSFEQASEAVLSSSETDWQQKPAYYQALGEWFSPERFARILQENS